MAEKFPSMPSSEHSPFQKGSLVRLRADISPSLAKDLEHFAKVGETYKIFLVTPNADEGGDTVWVGPADTSPADIDAFDTDVFEDDRLRVRYKRVFTISANHLTPVLN
jgi:hypothetical protein